MLYIRRVVGSSMEPALAPGQVVFAVKKRPKKGDIVIAKVAEREVIKRVCAVQNDTYDLRGDNQAHSTDSRTYGLVPRSDILAVVLTRR